MRVRRKEEIEEEWIQELESRKNQLTPSRPVHPVEGNVSRISRGEDNWKMSNRKLNEAQYLKAYKSKKKWTK